jgi:hypothetical protein
MDVKGKSYLDSFLKSNQQLSECPNHETLRDKKGKGKYIMILG